MRHTPNTLRKPNLGRNALVLAVAATSLLLSACTPEGRDAEKADNTKVNRRPSTHTGTTQEDKSPTDLSFVAKGQNVSVSVDSFSNERIGRVSVVDPSDDQYSTEYSVHCTTAGSLAYNATQSGESGIIMAWKGTADIAEDARYASLCGPEGIVTINTDRQAAKLFGAVTLQANHNEITETIEG